MIVLLLYLQIKLQIRLVQLLFKTTTYQLRTTTKVFFYLLLSFVIFNLAYNYTSFIDKETAELNIDLEDEELEEEKTIKDHFFSQQVILPINLNLILESKNPSNHSYILKDFVLGAETPPPEKC